MGCDRGAAAEFGGNCSNRSAEHVGWRETEKLGRRAERAHHGGSDAARVCRSRGVSGGSGFCKGAGGWVNQSVLREGAEFHDRRGASVVQQGNRRGATARLRNGSKYRSAARDQLERRATHDAFFRGGRSGKRGGKHVHVK